MIKNLIKEIIIWIRREVEKAGAKGIVVGISGGIDSSVVAILAKQAVQDNLLGLILPCHSNEEDLYYANMVAEKFEIKTKTIYLDTIYDKLIEILPVGNKIAVANIKPRLRMLVLYYFANYLNYLVAGTGNKSELMVGYFTKYGDGGADILPIGGLLKSQVRELAKELKVPEEILRRVPTAGLWQGQTDEAELGITYEDLDKSLEAIEKEKKHTEAIPQHIISKVEELIKISEHKRKPPKIFTLY